MKVNLNKLLFVACFLLLMLVGLRSFDQTSVPGESVAPDEPGSTAAESSIKRSLRWQRGMISEPEPQPDPVTSAPLELPENPEEIRKWARQNPEEALAWLPSANAGETRDIVAEIVCARMAESNPSEAVSLAESYSGACSNLLENLVHQWAERDELAATAYAMQRPSGEERDRLLSRVAFTRSKENPLDAAKLVAEWISPGDVQNEAAMSVLHQWALRDPKAALAWAQLFREESLRDRALNELWNIFSPVRE
jgi:hypothetical protein